MSTFQDFKNDILSTWAGEKPNGNILKSMYFEYLSRENRKNYTKKLKEKAKDLDYILKEIIIWVASIVFGTILLCWIFNLII
jgi:hypothetical protein